MFTRNLLTAVASITVIAAAAASCGSHTSDPGTMARDYYEQFARGNMTAACSMLTLSAADEVTAYSGADNCESGLSAIHDNLMPGATELYEATHVEQITFQTPDGYAEIADDDMYFGDVCACDSDADPRPMTFALLDGRWYITSFG